MNQLFPTIMSAQVEWWITVVASFVTMRLIIRGVRRWHYRRKLDAYAEKIVFPKPIKPDECNGVSARAVNYYPTE